MGVGDGTGTQAPTSIGLYSEFLDGTVLQVSLCQLEGVPLSAGGVLLTGHLEFPGHLSLRSLRTWPSCQSQPGHLEFLGTSSRMLPWMCCHPDSHAGLTHHPDSPVASDIQIHPGWHPDLLIVFGILIPSRFQ